MESPKTSKFKMGIIFSLMLSFIMAISAFCVYLAPTNNAKNVTENTIASAETNNISDISEKWADYATEPLTMPGRSLPIGSASALAGFAEEVNNGNDYSGYTVYLTRDINIADKLWTPIGINSVRGFSGIFDGRGYKITGLTINETTDSGVGCQGLFGYTSRSATIRNLFLQGISIRSGISTLGGLVGNNAGTIINCGVSGFITSSSSSSTAYIGGLIGSSSGAIYRSFSTVGIDANRGYIGGLVGNASSNVQQCFYYSEIGIDGGSSSGMIGRGSSSRVNDVYTSSSRISSNISGTQKVGDSSLWVSDTSGVMHGRNMKVLKGVGNIFVETKVMQFDPYYGIEVEDDTYEYLYNIMDGTSSGTKSINSGTYYNFPIIDVERNVASNTDIIATEISTSSNGIFFDNAAYGDYYRESLSFSASSASFFTNGNSSLELDNNTEDVYVEPNSNDYEFHLGNVASYYRVTLHSRGRWQRIKFNFYEYEEVDASSITRIENNDFTTTIRLVTSFSELYGNPSLDNIAMLGSVEAGSRTVYIPYNEYYTISFSTSSPDGISYLDMMSGWGSNIASGNVKRITQKVNLKGVTSIVDLPESNRKYTSSNRITSTTEINFYFNNIQQVTLQLYDVNNIETTSFHDISRTYPVFVDSTYSSSSANTSISSSSLTINVMANKDLRSYGFSIGNITGSGSVYALNGSLITFNDLIRNGKYAPYWPEFCLTGFFLGNGTRIIDSALSNTASYGTNITPNLTCASYTWNFRASDQQTLYAEWIPFQDSTSLQFSVVNEEENTSDVFSVTDAKNNNIIQNNEKFITMTSYDTMFDETYGLINDVERRSNQSAVFRFTVNKGYEINTENAITLILAGDDEQIISLDGFDDYYTGSSGNLLIGNNVAITWDSSTGEVVVTFDHLIGIKTIIFDLVPEKYNVSFNATIQGLENGTTANDLLSFRFKDEDYTLNLDEIVEFDYYYGSNISFANISAAKGYSFNSVVKVYYNGEENNTLFRVISSGDYITLEALPWTINLEEMRSIRIEFVVARNSGSVIVEFDGISPDYLVDEYIIRSLGSVEVSDMAETLSAVVNTDGRIVLNIQLTNAMSFASISNVECNYGDSEADISGLPTESTKSVNITIENIILEQDDIITLSVHFDFYEAVVDVVSITTKDTVQIGETTTLAQNKPLTYGFVIKKDLNNPQLQFVDGNNPENNFAIDIDYEAGASNIMILRGEDEIGEITNNSSLQVRVTGFQDGDRIIITIEYAQMTSEVLVSRVKLPKGGTSLTGFETIFHGTLVANEYVDLVDESAPGGYTLLGWYYVANDTMINLDGTTFSDLLPADIGEVKLISRRAEPSSEKEKVIRLYTYFVAVYEANDYTLVFDTSDYLDEVQSEQYKLLISSETQLTVEFATEEIRGTIPTASLENNDMLRFVGWRNTECGINLEYNERTGSFSVVVSWINPPREDPSVPIVLEPVFEPTTVTLYYCDEFGNRTGDFISVLYGQTPIGALQIPSSKMGYTFGGWKYQEELFYPYDDTNDTWGTAKPWTPMVHEADILPEWIPIPISVTFHAGLGTFLTGTTITATVDYETNIYLPDIPLTTPSWAPNGATYEFSGYYKAIFQGKEYYFYGPTDERNSICDFIDKNVVFYACYTLTAVDTTLSVEGQPTASWVYNGESYPLVINYTTELPLVPQWNTEKYYKDDVLTTNTILKDVEQSGVYVCNFDIQGGEILTSNGIRVFTSGVVSTSAEITVEITPKTVEIYQNNMPVDHVEKIFDNTINVSNIAFVGFVPGDNVTGSVEFTDKNVGTNKDIIIRFSGRHAGNYRCDEIFGTITPFEIIFIISGSGYCVGAENEKIVIATQNIGLDENSSRFLTQIGVRPTLLIQTSQNVAGIYTYTDETNKIEVVDFILTGSNADINNFTFTITGQFELIDPGAGNIVVQVSLLCEDRIDINPESIGTITVHGTFDDLLYNGSQNVYLVDTKSDFEQNPVLNIVLDRDVNYWIDRVIVNDAQTEVEINTSSSQDRILYDISGIESNAIIIEIYVTTLTTITFDYNLVEGESLEEEMPQSTKFAFQKTVQQSIDEYDAVLPNAEDIQRTGFVFTGWKLEINNNTFIDITTSTVWSYRGDIKLVAQYDMADIQLSFYVDRLLNEIVSNTSNFVWTYDAVSHILEYIINNQNDLAITYGYSWTKDSAQISNTTNTLTVRDVTDSGIYRLTIRATSKQNQLINSTVRITLNVTINQDAVFTNDYVITKEYDGTTATHVYTILVNGESLEIVGEYVSKNVGSGLDKSLQKWTINGTRADNPTLNYTLNFNDVDETLSVITKKNVVLVIGEQTKEFDGNVFRYNSSYTDQTPFDYTISSTSANVGTYNQDNDGVTLSIVGDSIDNFDISISGSLIITPKLIDITWRGTTTLTFDGNFHSVYPIVPDYINVTGITYSIDDEIMYEYASLEENRGAFNAGVYTVEFTYENTDGNMALNNGLICVFTINKRVIYLDYDGIFAEKFYDGTTAVNTDNKPNIYNNSSLTERLDTIVTNQDAMPEFIYEYISPTAGNKKTINVALADSTNYTINSSFCTLIGNILKRDATLYVVSEKIYDNNANYTVNSEDITAVGIVEGEIITGYVTFLGVRNSGSYYNLKTLQKTIVLNIGPYNYNTNYNISFIDSSEDQYDINHLIINKAKVVVSTDSNSEYEYTGTEVELVYSFLNSVNASVVPNVNNVVFTYSVVNSDTTLDNNKAVQVGRYRYNMSLTGLDDRNFEITGDISEVMFSIIPRNITIMFENNIEFEYQSSNVTYRKDDGTLPQTFEQLGTDNLILDENSTIGIGDVFNWSFTTKSNAVNAYYIYDENLIDRVLNVTKNGVDYTKNYNFNYNRNSAIIIKKLPINFNDITLVESISRYDGLVKKIKIRFYDKYLNNDLEFTFGDVGVSFEKFTHTLLTGDSRAVTSPNDIKYAGTYNFSLSFTSYEVADSGIFTYTITQSGLDLNVGDLTKVYDGSLAFNNVSLYKAIPAGSEQGINHAPYQGDNISVVARYPQKDVGNNLPIEFTLQSSNPYVLASYYIINRNYSGNIVQKEIELVLQDTYETFYIGDDISIDVSNFFVRSVNDESGLVNGEILLGNIIVPIIDTGSYALDDIDVMNIDFDILVETSNGEESAFSNYLITNIVGTVIIRQAHVLVDIDNVDTIYNGEVQNATFTFKSKEGYGDIIDNEVYADINVVYTNDQGIVSPINVGTYNIVISVAENSNYRLVNDDGNAVLSFTSSTKLTINKREILVSVEYTHAYDGNVAICQIRSENISDPTPNNMGGLITGHSLSGMLLTNGSTIGRYSISNIPSDEMNTSLPVYSQDVKVIITFSDKDVTTNYDIIYDATIIIVDEANINSDNITSIEYCAEDVTDLEEFFITFDFAGQDYEIRYNEVISLGNGYTANLCDLAQYVGDGTVQTIDKAIDVGRYRITLRINNNDEDEDLKIVDQYVSFTIIMRTITTIYGNFDKSYDGTSNVIGQLSSPDIYESDINGVDILGYYTQASGNTFAVGTHAISFVLEGNRSHNYRVALNGTIMGTISKQQIILSLTSSKNVYYTGEDRQIQISQFNALKTDGKELEESIIDNLAGTIIIITEVNVGKYSLEALFAQNDVRIELAGTIDILDNYEIIGYSGEFNINPCEIVVSIENDTTVYDAQAQEVSYSLNAINGRILETDRENLLTILYNDSSELPINAGSYSITAKVNDEYSQNYIIVDNIEQGTNFKILKREIQINIGTQDLPYTGSNVVYNITTEDIYKTSASSSGLLSLHTVTGYYQTSGKDMTDENGEIITYTVDGDIYKITRFNFDILQNGVTVTDNYDIVAENGTITISVAEDGYYDASHIQNLVYSAKDYVESGDIKVQVGINGTLVTFEYNEKNDFGILTGLCDEQKNLVSEAKNAGKYYIYLTVNGSDLFNNFEIEFTIAPRQISNLNYQSNKNYDGESSILGEITSDQIYETDRLSVEIRGDYVDDSGNKVSEKGEHFVLFSFSGNNDMESNYILPDFRQNTGSIFARDIYLEVAGESKTYSTYFINQAHEIDVTNFVAYLDDKDEIITDFIENVTGKVVVNLINTGTYDLSQNFDKINFDNLIQNNYLNNYNIVAVNGTFEIQRAEIIVEISDYTKVYNGEAQFPTYKLSVRDGHGEIPDENILAVTYTSKITTLSSPIDAGIYDIIISIQKAFSNNYGLYYNSSIVDNYTAIEKFEIEKKDLKITAYPEPLDYIGSSIIYTIKNEDIDGLVAGQVLDGTLTTNGYKGGVYSFNGEYTIGGNYVDYQITPSIQILYLTSDTTSNYNILIDSQITIISSLTNLDTSALEELIYDGTDKVSNEKIILSLLVDDEVKQFIYDKEYSGVEFSILTYRGEGLQTYEKAIYVGEYSFSVTFNINGATLSRDIQFTISPKVISKIDFTLDKLYDATDKVSGDITSTEILSNDNVQITGTYDSSNAGKQEITLLLNGKDAFNYIINPDLALSGEILKRDIVINVNNSVDYSGVNLQILPEDMSISGSGLVTGHTISGFIELLRKNAGTYKFNIGNVDLTQFVILATNEDVTSNYQIILQGSVTIGALHLDIILDNINLIYDALVKDITQYIIFSQTLSDELQTEARAAINVAYDNIPLNAGHYKGTISSKSSNFVFSAEPDNVIEFDIKQRDLQIDIGNIIYAFNPNSTHETQFVIDYLKGIVEGQVVEGSFRLSQEGLGIGQYSFTTNPGIVIESLAIYVNGQDILELNYKINDVMLGSITIDPFELSNADIWLSEDEITYIGVDISDLLIINFRDANGDIKQITRQDPTYGTFTISNEEGVAINAGEYFVNVNITNYTNSSKITLRITPKTITIIDNLETERVYNGSSYVYDNDGRRGLFSPDILAADRGNLTLYGYFVDNLGNQVSSIGNHRIVFEFGEKDTYPALNYVIDFETTGEIYLKDIKITINHQFAYSASGSYTLTVEHNLEAFVTNGLLSADRLSGEITINNLIGVIGSITESQINSSSLIILNTDGENVVSNYNVTIISEIEIVKAQIIISFDGIEKRYEYNNKPVIITPTLTFKNSNEEVSLDYLNSIYTGDRYESPNAPKNVGNYNFTYSIAPNFEQFYEFVTETSFEFEIYTFDLILNIGDIPNDRFFKQYGASDPEIKYTIVSEFNEEIIITFNREPGEEIGRYDLYIKEWDNTNYSIKFADGAGNDLFRIVKAGNLNIIILDTEHNREILQKEYDHHNISPIDISLLDYDADGQLVTGKINFQVGINVGEYQLASTHELVNDNYETFTVTSLLNFVITPKSISLSILEGSGDKEYDASTDFLGEIIITDSDGEILDIQEFPLVATASFANANVGENIALTVSFSGDNISNYQVTNSLSANITTRSVTITPYSDQAIEYGSDYVIKYEIIDNGTSAFKGILESEISGELYVENYDAGSWPILSGLTSNNLDIKFTPDVLLNITPKELVITSSDNFQKVYDTNNFVVGELTIQGIIGNDNVDVNAYYDSPDVGNNKIVSFVISGDDAKNYYAEDVLGSILELKVTLNYNYIPDGFSMINPNLLQNNSRLKDSLVYGSSIATSIGSLPVPSHEGYTFDGWYLDEDLSIQLDDQTIIDESIWSLDTHEKVAYAKWTIKQFELNIEIATRVNGIYVLDTENPGGTHDNISGFYDYGSVVLLTGKAHVNYGYTFVGYSFDLILEADQSILENGITIGAKQTIVYAKFAPLSVVITLGSNGGVFDTNISGWVFKNNNTIATRTVDFNSEIGVELPQANRVGYKQNIALWDNDAGTSYTLSSETVMDETFYPECNLKVHYDPEKYDFILNANGGYFDSVDETIWEIRETNGQGDAIIIAKEVTYDQPVGNMIIPKRDGYNFASWSIDNLNEDYIWQNISQDEITATWEEREFNIEITANNGVIEYKVEDSASLTVKTGNIDNTTEIITVKTTHKLTLNAINDAGYTFVSWNSNKQDIAGHRETQISTTTDFVDDYFVEAIFDANSNTITIEVNAPNRGYATADGQSTSSEIQSIRVVVKTGLTLDILATSYEGYTIIDWLVSGDGDILYNLDGTNTDSERTLSGFVSDIKITICFAPAGNDLTIQADAQMGVIHYLNNGQEIITSGSYTAVGVLTETTFKFDIEASHGYIVDLNLKNWLFDTTSENKGSFNITTEDNGYSVHVEFTGFTASGTIIVPFIRDEFEVTIGVVLKDDTNFTPYDAENILSIQIGDHLLHLSSGDSFSGEYLLQVILSAQDVIKGFDFFKYSISPTNVESISSSTGFVDYTENGDVIYNIVDDMTLYLVYEIERYDVTFVVNDNTMGSLSYGIDGNSTFIRTTSVKYGYDSAPVTAVAGEHFEFDKWIRVVLVNGVYEPYLIDGQPIEYENDILIVENVSEECIFMAVFKGIPISFSVSLILPDEDVFTEEKIDFAWLSILGENTNTSITSTQREGNTITYIISTITGEDIDLSIACAEGYEYIGILTMDPRLLYNITRSDSDVTLSLENLYLSTKIELSIRAKVYEIAFNLVGEPVGAELYPISNMEVEGIVDYEYSFDRKSLVFKAKNGCDVKSILYVLNGYKLVDNSYFEKLGDETYSDVSFDASYLGTLSNINGNLEINVQIEPNIYRITFDLGYEVEEGNRMFVSDIAYGKTNFSPVLTNEFISPTRYAYRFVGYTTINLSLPGSSSGIYYYFDAGGIYSYMIVNNVSTKVYGFRGADNAVPSTLEGIDYELTLYASWEEMSYEVELVFVPDFALDQTNLNYNEIFPNSEGRVENIENGRTISIEYKPGSTVLINSPLNGFDGYTYYGWSYNEGIVSKIDENLKTDICEFIMGEEAVTIYLYYGMSVDVSASQGGSAEISSDIALYGETISLKATSNFGYFFDHWLENSTELQDSKAEMNVVVTAPTNYFAVFVGESIEVNINQVENARLNITATTGIQNEYRIGDTITLTISDVTYGYEHKDWVSGGYSGTIRTVDSYNFNYTIVPEDLIRGFVTFELIMGARDLNIRFSIVGDGDCGDILVNGTSVGQQTLVYSYDELIDIMIDISLRYELLSFTLNGRDITLDDENSVEMVLNQAIGITYEETNEFVATFRKMLWTDVWSPFTGLGTEESPYLIKTNEQLAAIAYLINNNIAVDIGAIPYANAYYLVNADLLLTSRFWVPIGTMQNPFNGTFNLNGYDINDLEPNDWTLVNAHPDGMPYGLFGYIGENAKFITGEGNYTMVMIIVFSIISSILLIILIILLILTLRRKRMRRISEASASMNIMSQDELLKAQKLKAKRSRSKVNKK